MGNSYYVQPDNTGLQWANFGVNLADTLSRRKLMMEDQALRGRALDETARQHNISSWGTETAQPGTPTLQQRQVGAQEQNAATTAAQLPQHKRNFGTVTAKLGQSTLTRLGVKKENPLFTSLEEMANNPAIDNEQAYLRLKNDYPTYYQTLKNEIADSYVKNFEKDENYANTPEGKKQLQILDALDQDKTGDTVLGGFFPGTVQSMEMEERKLRAAQTPVAVVGADGRPRYMSAEDAMRTGAERFIPNSEKKSVTNIQADILRKWLDGEPLTKQETQIKDKYFRGDKDTYADNMQRWKAKVDSFELVLGRKATEEEKRRLFINDMYGILAPPSPDNPAAPGAPAPAAPQGKKDKYGFTVGQKTTKNGKTYKYIGNNQWQVQS
jgi:hypothetical protein